LPQNLPKAELMILEIAAPPAAAEGAKVLGN
jgi:hypothetical protein